MSWTHPDWLEHQRQRWMRHDAERWIRPDAKRWQKPQPHGSKSDNSALKYSTTADAESEEELLQRRHEIVALRLEWELLKLAWKGQKAGFNPSQPRDDQGRWTDTGSNGGDTAEGDDDGSSAPAEIEDEPLHVIQAALRPRIPPERPPTGPERTAVAKALAIWLAQRGADVADYVTRNSWLFQTIPTIRSYLDEPKTLHELQQNASTVRPGYDRHHIVEQTSAEDDGYSRRRIDSLENVVGIPRMKHWEITAWYQTKNPDYQDMSPRDYLRGKDWNERRRVGLDALIKFGVLQP